MDITLERELKHLTTARTQRGQWIAAAWAAKAGLILDANGMRPCTPAQRRKWQQECATAVTLARDWNRFLVRIKRSVARIKALP